MVNKLKQPSFDEPDEIIHRLKIHFDAVGADVNEKDNPNWAIEQERLEDQVPRIRRIGSVGYVGSGLTPLQNVPVSISRRDVELGQLPRRKPAGQ